MCELARGLVALAVLTVCLGGVAVGSPTSSAPAAPAAPHGIPPDFEAACGTDNPYLVTTCYFPPLDGVPYRYQDAPAILAFRDTSQNAPQYRLAAQPEAGALWGLAYSRSEQAVYAAAFHKRQVPFGPGGPGAIYRIDLGTGAIAQLATIPNAGPDRHAHGRGSDIAGRDWAGKTSLGDIDLNEDGSELLVMNLADRHIYRLAMPSGQVLGSFAHGAAGESWAEDARPFGLKVHAGRVYHGVVHSAERSRRPTDLAAYVYSSLADGSDMRLEVRFALDYARGVVDFRFLDRFSSAARLNWRPWARGYNTLIEPSSQIIPVPAVYPMPILADIEFVANDNMILGLRDRQVDVTLNFTANGALLEEVTGMGFGDILIARLSPTGWDVQVDPEPFDDRADLEVAESSQGGLAILERSSQIVNSAFGFAYNGVITNLSWEPGALWYDHSSGNKVRSEVVCGVFINPPVFMGVGHGTQANPLDLDDDAVFPSNSVGDVEVLCGPSPTPSPTPTPTEAPSPTFTPTATARATTTATSTATATATRTPTAAPSATVTATASPKPSPIYLPLALREPPCAAERTHIDVVLILDASTSMLETTRAGRSKLDAAREAARLFLDQLDLRGPPASGSGSPGGSPGDQAALVQFNADARLLQPLTGDRAVLQAALAGIQPSQFTRIDLGIRAGHAELASPRHLADHQPALIVLTDGRNNPEPVSSAIAAAAEAKAAGMRVFAIGLGEDVETGALVLMASQPGDYFAAPDGEDLAGIYRAIAGAVRPCPATWAGRP